ncbi:MAG TPA: phosphoribosylformylglycinamidine synthase subunit PurS [Longimicrobiaceae bacterium]|nr:phosphoribosylformylglycinamidine synthase subunit PurS [Longimicrobiaceae bacterium]
MTDFRVEVQVTPRRGLLDPQGNAVEGALRALGFAGAQQVHVGRLIVFTLAAESQAQAVERTEAMCRQLLANPVTEDFRVQVRELAGAGA